MKQEIHFDDLRNQIGFVTTGYKLLADYSGKFNAFNNSKRLLRAGFKMPYTYSCDELLSRADK
jgi:hypothetical protein